MRGKAAAAAALLLATLPAAATAQDEPRLSVRAYSGPETGARAPDFSLARTSADSAGIGELWSLGRQRDRLVVLVFFARAFTPSSAVQLQTLNTRIDEFRAGGEAVLVAVSADSLATLQSFAERLTLGFPLLSDVGQATARRYGARTREGFPAPSAFVIDRAGIVRYVDADFRPKESKEYDRLLEALSRARSGRSTN